MLRPGGRVNRGTGGIQDANIPKKRAAMDIKKFGLPQNPLEMEAKLRVMEPLPTEFWLALQKNIEDMYSTAVRDNKPVDKLIAERLIANYADDRYDMLKNEIRLEFANSFRCWLATYHRFGMGKISVNFNTDEQKWKIEYVPGDELSPNDPQQVHAMPKVIADYFRAHIDAASDYQKKMVHLKDKDLKSLLDYYMYFKYIVGGNTPNAGHDVQESGFNELPDGFLANYLATPADPEWLPPEFNQEECLDDEMNIRRHAIINRHFAEAVPEGRRSESSEVNFNSGATMSESASQPPVTSQPPPETETAAQQRDSSVDPPPVDNGTETGDPVEEESGSESDTEEVAVTQDKGKQEEREEEQEEEKETKRPQESNGETSQGRTKSDRPRSKVDASTKNSEEKDSTGHVAREESRVEKELKDLREALEKMKEKERRHKMKKMLRQQDELTKRLALRLQQLEAKPAPQVQTDPQIQSLEAQQKKIDQEIASNAQEQSDILQKGLAKLAETRARHAAEREAEKEKEEKKEDIPPKSVDVQESEDKEQIANLLQQVEELKKRNAELEEKTKQRQEEEKEEEVIPPQDVQEPDENVMVKEIEQLRSKNEELQKLVADMSKESSKHEQKTKDDVSLLARINSKLMEKVTSNQEQLQQHQQKVQEAEATVQTQKDTIEQLKSRLKATKEEVSKLQASQAAKTSLSEEEVSNVMKDLPPDQTEFTREQVAELRSQDHNVFVLQAQKEKQRLDAEAKQEVAKVKASAATKEAMLQTKLQKNSIEFQNKLRAIEARAARERQGDEERRQMLMERTAALTTQLQESEASLQNLRQLAQIEVAQERETANALRTAVDNLQSQVEAANQTITELLHRQTLPLPVTLQTKEQEEGPVGGPIRKQATPSSVRVAKATDPLQLGKAERQRDRLGRFVRTDIRRSAKASEIENAPGPSVRESEARLERKEVRQLAEKMRTTAPGEEPGTAATTAETLHNHMRDLERNVRDLVNDKRALALSKQLRETQSPTTVIALYKILRHENQKRLARNLVRLANFFLSKEDFIKVNKAVVKENKVLGKRNGRKSKASRKRDKGKQEEDA